MSQEAPVILCNVLYQHYHLQEFSKRDTALYKMQNRTEIKAFPVWSDIPQYPVFWGKSLAIPGTVKTQFLPHESKHFYGEPYFEKGICCCIVTHCARNFHSLVLQVLSVSMCDLN